MGGGGSGRGGVGRGGGGARWDVRWVFVGWPLGWVLVDFTRTVVFVFFRVFGFVFEFVRYRCYVKTKDEIGHYFCFRKSVVYGI